MGRLQEHQEHRICSRQEVEVEAHLGLRRVSLDKGKRVDRERVLRTLKESGVQLGLNQVWRTYCTCEIWDRAYPKTWFMKCLAGTASSPPSR
mmetsp:Transcript_28449/g.46113  ORF Transcript_28449/g.46113 Transcript_28449/m.46113 type:complete len:92 (+) Transcript_28449:1496-1771(+)